MPHPSGAALLINGLGLLGRVPARDSGYFNLLIGSTQLVLSVLIAIGANGEAATLLGASGVFLFGLTYLYVGLNALLSLGSAGLGWFCGLVALLGVFFAVDKLATDPLLGVLWFTWAGLWTLFFLILGLGVTGLTRFTGWALVLTSQVTTTVPAVLGLKGAWPTGWTAAGITLALVVLLFAASAVLAKREPSASVAVGPADAASSATPQPAHAAPLPRLTGAAGTRPLHPINRITIERPMNMTASSATTAPETAVNYEDLAARFRPIFDRIAVGASARRTGPPAALRADQGADGCRLRRPARAHRRRRVRRHPAAAVPPAHRARRSRLEHSAGAARTLRVRGGPPRGIRRSARPLARPFRGRRDRGQLVDRGRFGADRRRDHQGSSGADKPGELRVNGTKYYSTGSIFADWIDTFAQVGDTGKNVIAVVNAHQPGVTHGDDWDGFGQRTTGSGTSTFVDAVVEPENVIDFDTRFKYQTAFYQAVLLSVLAGTIKAAERDIAAEVKARTRIFSHGNADSFAADPQILQVVGEVSAQAFAADAIVERAAQALQGAYEGAFLGDVDEDERRNDIAELATAQAQVVLTALATRATSDIFDALAASGVSRTKNLDRHWRNARTAGSHNPWVFKARIIGDYVVNGTQPNRIWAIGASPTAGK